MFLTAPLIRELSQLRSWSVDTLLVARSRGGFWSRQQDSVLLPLDTSGIVSPDDPHDAYISDLAVRENRELLQARADGGSLTPIYRSVCCPDVECTFRVRFETILMSDEIPELPKLLHQPAPARCDDCLEESVHCLEQDGVIRCAHCGSTDSLDGELEATS